MSEDLKRAPGPPSDDRMAELEATHHQMMADRAEAMERIRRRAGLSVDELAKEMGFKGASSIQRYLGRAYERGFRPEIARAFRTAFLGRGNPPITDEDLHFLLAMKQVEPTDPIWETYQTGVRLSEYRQTLNPDEGGGRLTVRLPLTEGDVVVEMPRYMTVKSAAALRAWLAHISDYTEDWAKLFEERATQKSMAQPHTLKKW